MIAGLLSTAFGFVDTASVYSNRELPSKYVISSQELIDYVNSNYCNEPIQILTTINGTEGLDWNVVKHVKYDNRDNVDELRMVCGGQPQIIHDMSEIDDSKVVIIQSIPSFPSISDNVVRFINSLTKRDNDLEELLDEVAILEQVEQEFELAESLAAAEDQQVHILGQDAATVVRGNKSLFTTYQFFSSGIFMCLIVSLVLILIFRIALGWLTSIEITYKSFEREVDYQKKNE